MIQKSTVQEILQVRACKQAPETYLFFPISIKVTKGQGANIISSDLKLKAKTNTAEPQPFPKAFGCKETITNIKNPFLVAILCMDITTWPS